MYWVHLFVSIIGMPKILSTFVLKGDVSFSFISFSCVKFLPSVFFYYALKSCLFSSAGFHFVVGASLLSPVWFMEIESALFWLLVCILERIFTEIVCA